MKGISAVLATVLIVVITVAIIGMAYGWATGMFKMTTSGATDETESQIAKMQKSVDIISVKCSNSTHPTVYISAGIPIGGGDPETNILTFSVKNTGTSNIETGELSAFLNNTDIDNTFSASNDIKTTELMSGETKEFIYHSSAQHNNNQLWTLKIDAPAGSVERSVICTPLVY